MRGFAFSIGWAMPSTLGVVPSLLGSIANMVPWRGSPWGLPPGLHQPQWGLLFGRGMDDPWPARLVGRWVARVGDEDPGSGT